MRAVPPPGKSSPKGWPELPPVASPTIKPLFIDLFAFVCWTMSLHEASDRLLR
jgi:hypothetical protein